MDIAALKDRRSDDPVVVTTRDIYDLALETKSTVDSLLQLHSQTSQGFSDHEARIRRLETRFYGIVGTIGLSAVLVAVYFLERASS